MKLASAEWLTILYLGLNRGTSRDPLRAEAGWLILLPDRLWAQNPHLPAAVPVAPNVSCLLRSAWHFAHCQPMSHKPERSNFLPTQPHAHTRIHTDTKVEKNWMNEPRQAVMHMHTQTAHSPTHWNMQVLYNNPSTSCATLTQNNLCWLDGLVNRAGTQVHQVST